MPIDEALLTPDILDNTLARDTFTKVRIVPGTTPKMGKVRTVYDIGKKEGDGLLLMVSSDNLSTHDVVHPRRVYGKGENLDAISSHFFELTSGIIPNHYLETIGPNAWIVRRAEPILVEMVLRAYLTGSGWKAYLQAEGPDKGVNFCGVPLRPGYCKNARLDSVIITPTAKGQAKDFPIPEFAGLNPEKDDPPITLDMIRRNYQAFGLRKPEDLDVITNAARKLYQLINRELLATGNLLADTKWEFGYLPDGSIALIDECVTPDSSRFWSAEEYRYDPSKNLFVAVQRDKQHFRDYIEMLKLHLDKDLLSKYWMPDEVIRTGVKLYGDMREAITGTQMLITTDPVRERVIAALDKRGMLK
ncbi:MAG: phosphoribosylaminoimidazolesuccinocarboxamide synthase [Candidatus Pacearchaeota archaeon]|nr:phosphoribosylaminoimidazolesuccinocarboxamide synthase [Candidatus Pacearchaeota archaeon]